MIKQARLTERRQLRFAIRAADADPDTLPYTGPLVRPRTRGDCADVPRPCPWVSCRHHMYLDATRAGSISILDPQTEVHDMRESCSLDVADRGPQSLHQVAEVMGVTRQMVQSFEAAALRAAAKALLNAGVVDRADK